MAAEESLRRIHESLFNIGSTTTVIPRSILLGTQAGVVVNAHLTNDIYVYYITHNTIPIHEWWDQLIAPWKRDLQSPCMRCRFLIWDIAPFEYQKNKNRIKDSLGVLSKCPEFEEHPDLLAEAMDRLIQTITKRT